MALDTVLYLVYINVTQHCSLHVESGLCGQLVPVTVLRTSCLYLAEAVDQQTPHVGYRYLPVCSSVDFCNIMQKYILTAPCFHSFDVLVYAAHLSVRLCFAVKSFTNI